MLFAIIRICTIGSWNSYAKSRRFLTSNIPLRRWLGFVRTGRNLLLIVCPLHSPTHIAELSLCTVKVPRADDPDREAKKQAWVNINNFCATLSKTRTPELDERSLSAWVLKEALEKAPWEEASHPDLEEMLEEDPDDEVVAEEVAYEYESRKVGVLEYWVPAAAAWMNIDAKGILEMKGRISVADDEEWEPTLWRGRKGWSRERFEFWRGRFEVISGMEKLSESTRNEAVEAVRCMEAVL